MNTTVLIVEDNDFLKSMFSSKLKEETSWNLELCDNGEDAIKIAKAKAPNLIFLDLILPGITGFDVIEELRKDKNLDKTHIVVMSVLGQEEDINRAKKLGADDYIIKSDLNMDEILSIAKKILSE